MYHVDTAYHCHSSAGRVRPNSSDSEFQRTAFGRSSATVSNPQWPKAASDFWFYIGGAGHLSINHLLLLLTLWHTCGKRCVIIRLNAWTDQQIGGPVRDKETSRRRLVTVDRKFVKTFIAETQSDISNCLPHRTSAISSTSRREQIGCDLPCRNSK